MSISRVYSTANSNERWYTAKIAEPHERLFSAVQELDDYQNTRRTKNQHHLSLFLNRQHVGLRPGDIDANLQVYNDLTLNIVNSAISTIASRICMHHPRPMFLTEDGSYQEQEKAKKLQKFVQGVFSQSRVNVVQAPRAFHDASIFEYGCCKVFSSNGKIKIQRVLSDEVFVDEDACVSAPPRELFQIKYVPKSVLNNWFPKSKQFIKEARAPSDLVKHGLTDLVEVVEAWHLPSGPGAKDGKHILAVSNRTLIYEDWNREEFPFAFLRWSEVPVGFAGQSLAEQLAPIQLEINKTMLRIQESMHLMATSYVVLDKGSGINKRHLKNIPGVILEKSGGPDPRIVHNAGVHPQVIEYLDYLYQRAYEIAGISQLSAHSKRPEGLRSGIALRHLLDAESQRFGLVARAWESFHCDLARLVVTEARAIHEQGQEIQVNYPDKEWIQKIKWSDCNLEEDHYTLNVYPTSQLPQTPAGKIALVEDLSAVGAISDPAVVLDLLQLPDVDKYASLETAHIRSAHQIAEYLLDGDENYIAPEEFMNLESMLAVMQKYWIKAHKDNVPEARLENLGRFMRESMQMLEDSRLRAAEEQAALQAASAPPGQPAPGQQGMSTEAATQLATGMPASLSIENAEFNQ